MTDAELVRAAVARVGSVARLADLMWVEPRNVRRYASGEKALPSVKRAKLEALVEGNGYIVTDEDPKLVADLWRLVCQSSSVSAGNGLDGGTTGGDGSGGGGSNTTA